MDAVELHNPGNLAANIGGWFLTDDFTTPRKYVFPADSRVPAGGYLVLTANDFGTGSGAFSLSSLGDELYLFSADGTRLTGFVHGFRFGASANGVSFGRHVDSLGREHFVAQEHPSFTQANRGPATGLAIVSEIQFKPPLAGTVNNTLDEFIELENTTAQSLPLFDPLHPTNTWRLAGGVEFALPQNVTLPANGHLLVVSFDPARDFGPLESFRTRYAVPTGVPILGPYLGSLNNAGDRVALLRPDPPQTAPSPDAGFVPYVLVDEINYLPAAPWPSGADGTGQSLQRKAAGLFGDDPAHWIVAAPTAGLPTTPGDDDADDDGLPDDWETAHGLDPRSAAGPDGAEGDPDADGLTNAQEYASGTHPRDSSSRLAIETLVVDDTGTLLRFEAQAGHTYTVLFAENLRTGAWQRLQDVPAGSAPVTVEVRDPARQGQRFYRVVTPLAP